MGKMTGYTSSPTPRKRIFLRFFILNSLLAFLTVMVFGISMIPSQKKKIIAGMRNYSKLIQLALYSDVSSAIVLEDYGEAIETSLMVIKENPNVLYVVFGRKNGTAIVNLNGKWYQEPMERLSGSISRDQQFVMSPIVHEEVFNTCYSVTLLGVDWGTIHVGLSSAEYHHDLTVLYIRTLTIGLLSVMVSLVISYGLARKMTRPIQELAQTTLLIGSGDLTVRSDIETGDELEVLSHAINRMVSALKNSRDEIKKKHDLLLDAAHRAGMAEVAIDVLHNVGNVLNSINVITSSVTSKVQQSRAPFISAFTREIEENKHRLPDYFNEDGRVEKMIRFLNAMVEHLGNENISIRKDMEELANHTGYITDIIRCQQLYSKPAGVMEPATIDELIRMAIQICGSPVENRHVRIVFNETGLPDMILNRHKIIQILTNLINNAIDAVLESDTKNKTIAISAELISGQELVIRVEDNGIGVPDELKINIFNHGFTTKKNGHGFGLHSCALFAQEMRGHLTVASSGKNMGALFELRLPVE